LKRVPPPPISWPQSSGRGTVPTVQMFGRRALPPPPVVVPRGLALNRPRPVNIAVGRAVAQCATATAPAPAPTGGGGPGGGGPPRKPLPPQEDEFKQVLVSQGKKADGYPTTTARLGAAGFQNIGGGWIKPGAGLARAHIWGRAGGPGRYIVQGITFGQHGDDGRPTMEFGTMGFLMLMAIYHL
jgi:hypothetical protein